RRLRACLRLTITGGAPLTSVVMDNKPRALFEDNRPPSPLRRLVGTVGGLVTGAILSAVVYILLGPLLHVLARGVSVLGAFAIVGGCIGGVLGFLAPKAMLEIAWV